MAVSLNQKAGGGNKKMSFRKRKWAVNDVMDFGVILLEHIGALFAPFYFTWGAFWVAVTLYWVTGIFGISLSYHRNLAHKSFKIPKWLEYLFAYCGMLAVQKDPIFWVSTHRYHHQFTDTYRDPHSPIEGFWFSHITWLFEHYYMKEKFAKQSNNVMDLRKQAYYRFLRRTFPLHYIGFGLVMYAVGGLPYLIWGMAVRLMCATHVTLMVNSVCHTWGKRPWDTTDLSRNNWLLGLLAFGEGWHNNHHAFEFSARLGLEWWEIDLPWYVVKLLAYVGLATDVKVPSEIQKRKMSATNKINNEIHEVNDYQTIDG